jgi:hypothetical protein
VEFLNAEAATAAGVVAIAPKTRNKTKTKTNPILTSAYYSFLLVSLSFHRRQLELVVNKGDFGPH